MSEKGITFSVFTKMWKDKSIGELGEFVRGLGFDGIELPVRPEYPVAPDTVASALPQAAKELDQLGVRITSVAGPTDEATIAACGAAGVPVIRTCPDIGDEGYLASIERHQRAFDALVPLLERHGVALGIQNHEGAWLCNALGIKHLIERYDRRHIAAIPCAGHTALDGAFASKRRNATPPYLNCPSACAIKLPPTSPSRTLSKRSAQTPKTWSTSSTAI